MEHAIILDILLVGLVIILAIGLRYGASRLGFPVLVGYIAIGLLLRLVDIQWPLLSEEGATVFAFLADVGITVLCL